MLPKPRSQLAGHQPVEAPVGQPDVGRVDPAHRLGLSGGLVELATDNFDYFMWLKGTLIEAGESLWRQSREQKNKRLLNPEIKTNFELKYEAEGRDLYYVELEK